MSLVATDLPEEVASLLIPLSSVYLLLPNVSVAEIIPYRQPSVQEDAPSWLLGMLEWRNTFVPTVSFEELMGQNAETINPLSQLAILNTSSGRVPFIGVLTQGVPRLKRISPSDIKEDGEVTLGELSRVIVGDMEKAVIPDIAFIESALLEVL